MPPSGCLYPVYQALIGEREILERMVGKRKKSEGEALAEEEQPQLKKRQLLPSLIKNKEKRSAVHAKLKREKKLEKRKKTKARDAAEKRALELGEEPPLKKVPRTIENTRESDETVCMPDDEELFAANDVDEFSAILKRERTPKILITTCRFNSTRGPTFISELLSVIPNAHYYKRGTYDLKKIVDYAKNDDFTSLIVVHTNRREPDALLIIGLPDGPTAHFKLSKLVLRKDIKVCKHQFFFSCSCISSLVNQATRCIKCFYLQ
ncbi:ribosome production factor 1-like isoform X1 [Macadamia integrifolia]|uniref:ribosome production factor 1-like isoform X1 n=2 Tax=Macadamia integrifolia TaxID=60698 RepID=UPI001C4F99EF|nr:ribosome production factor 1-like isoform X1 [Macadamia integrifolia]